MPTIDTIVKFNEFGCWIRGLGRRAIGWFYGLNQLKAAKCFRTLAVDWRLLAIQFFFRSFDFVTKNRRIKGKQKSVMNKRKKNFGHNLASQIHTERTASKFEYKFVITSWIYDSWKIWKFWVLSVLGVRWIWIYRVKAHKYGCYGSYNQYETKFILYYTVLVNSLDKWQVCICFAYSEQCKAMRNARTKWALTTVFTWN